MTTLPSLKVDMTTPGATQRANAPVGARRYELDWLRALVVLGLIPFHAAVIFSVSSDAYLKNAQSSVALSVLGAFAGVWGMPLLFLVGGAGVLFALRKRSVGQFLGERSKRLLIPFVFATLVIVPIQVYFVLKGNPSLMKSFDIPIPDPQQAVASYFSFYGQFLWGYGYFLTHFRPGLVPVFWGHLWFIPRLFAYTLVTLPLFRFLRGAKGLRAIDWLANACKRPGVILLFGLPLVLVEAILQSGWLNKLTAHWFLYDDWSQFFFYLIFFIFGYVLYADARFVKAVERHAWAALGLGVVCFVGSQMLNIGAITIPLSSSVGPVFSLPIRGILTWFLVLGVLGLASRYLNRTNAAERYLNEATYPLYVLHMPILTAIGYSLLPWNVNLLLKFACIVVATFAATLIVYEMLVRRIPVSRFLVGAKRPATASNTRAAFAVEAGQGDRDVAEKGYIMSTLENERPAEATTAGATNLSEVATISRNTQQPYKNLAQMFRGRSAYFGDAVRWRQVVDGSWMSMTWRENAALVNELIAGLDALGVRPGESIGILSGTRWEWLAADWAILGLGGVTITLYPSNTPETIEFMVNDADVRYLFIENRNQYDKLLSIREKVPGIRRLIMFSDAEQVSSDPWVLPFADLRALGGRSPAEAEALAAQRAEAIQPDDPSSIVYTSGTTGRPKGVVLSHATLVAQTAGVRALLTTLHPGMVDLLFLPLAHVLGREEHLIGIEFGLETTITTNTDQLANDLKTVKPNLVIAYPRVFEKAYAAFQAQVSAGSRITQRIAAWAVRIGKSVANRRERHEPISFYLALPYWIADRLVFRRVRARLGGQLEFVVSGGAPLDRDILDFFHAAGVLLLEGWGLTETGGAFTINRVENYRRGSVGLRYPDHDIRIASDGEILVRGPCVFSHYHHNDAETAAAFDQDGWFMTGDIGSVDADGFVRITDRKKDLIATAGGKKIAPQEIEQLLGGIRGVSHAAVFGDRKPYLVALIALDDAEARRWAVEAGIGNPDTGQLAAHPRFRSYLDGEVSRVNAHLARYETVKRFAIVPEDFTVENGLLTPTLKIRRRQIQSAYLPMIEQLYANGARPATEPNREQPPVPQAQGGGAV
ncbi:MAG TPA: AMP-binding protein [Ktedonobacterales bacterium]